MKDNSNSSRNRTNTPPLQQIRTDIGSLYSADLTSYKTACREDPDLRSFDSSAITNGIAEFLIPVGLLLLPIVPSFRPVSPPGTEANHKVNGSPVRVALFVGLILLLLYHRFSIRRMTEAAEI
ncbi:unnamed protein product [Microthlaspi erraticum]|uniref:Uncharacterized protein n=1 Tax=Microthlaspi erraticum TaxID=1685480 RepID=A0A6D2IZJ2_9BRAS|nr:unnamed protein product [Microthlaspi erraticum]